MSKESIFVLFFLLKNVFSIIICTFALREPAKPFNDAQMCGSFFYGYMAKKFVYKNIFHTPRVSTIIQSKRYGDNR